MLSKLEEKIGQLFESFLRSASDSSKCEKTVAKISQKTTKAESVEANIEKLEEKVSKNF